MSKLRIMYCLAIFFLLAVSFCDSLNPGSSKEFHNPSYDTQTQNGMFKQDFIFIRGKYFNRNGKAGSSISATPPEIFQQCLDHMNSSCSQTWNQRYWVNREYYRDQGPMFFMLGAEGAADGWADGGQWMSYARTYGALIVLLEHRFYGESIPTRNSTFESLQLLTSQQALADGANFVEWFKDTNNITNTKVVVFGGSYGGNLAAWMRQKYPQVVNLAVASSGPIEAKFDYTEYMESISETIFAKDPNCFLAIREAYACMQNISNGILCYSSSLTNSAQLGQVLNLCYDYDLNDFMEKQYFFQLLTIGTWASNYPWTSNEPNCKALLLENRNEMDVLKAYGNFMLNTDQWGACPRSELDSSVQGKKSYREDVHNFINSEEGIYAGAAGWYWQTCYEFGYYQTADPVYGLFGKDFFTDIYVEECQAEYGDIFTSAYIQARVKSSNDYYKGLKYEGTCTIFVNGEYDPWHTLGLHEQSATSVNNTVVYIPEGEHCDDMLLSTKVNIRTAQAAIEAQIGIYLNDPTCN